MVATIIGRVIDALCAGRAREDVIARVALAFGAGAMLWLCIAILIVLDQPA